MVRRNEHEIPQKSSIIGFQKSRGSMKLNFTSILLFIGMIPLIQSCSSTKNVQSETVILDDVVVMPEEPTTYQATETQKFDLLHTELHVKFDWKKQYLLGKATLQLKPYFYETDKLELDAKGFDIHKVELKQNGKQTPLKYEYDSLVIDIILPKVFTKKDTFQVYIEYTAKPNEIKQKGSAAITDAKGLYFINPLGEEADKPMQIWTQGETESSSCWFPTIDIPNEKMTHEIYITVDEKYKTLSNGELMYQTENGNGTRTDYWKQHKPHSTYLVMMAIGDFAVVEDSWRDTVAVNYYVEHEFEQYAKDIFGLTPEMIEFFSKELGVDYPWYKYHQVVVRDYVSGAMENTSAVIHGEFLHQTKREMIDGDNQDIIAHELFHHWFGDLVTCESWSNLPLNESFATYGEYMWREYKQGRESADEHLDDDLKSYLREARYKQVDMIRYDYSDKEDMFDSHSYAKGGRILHMLRKYVGDEAFYESLKVYLTDNAYNTAEIHDLRKAFEKVTGEDLNWFFNQWFLASGHPKLDINTTYNDSTKQLDISVKQLQDRSTTPLYQLPMAVDIYTSKGKERKEIILREEEQIFTFKYAEQPKLVNVDAEKMLLCEKFENKSLDEWIYQYNSTPLYIDRLEAIAGIAPFVSTNEEAFETLLSSLNDPNENIRQQTIKKLEPVAEKRRDEVEALLIKVAKEDKTSLVRAEAILALGNYYRDTLHTTLFSAALKDSSYRVMKEALVALSKVNSEEAMKLAAGLENESNKRLQYAVAEVYAQNGDATVHPYFVKMAENVSGYAKYAFIPAYVEFLSRNTDVDVLNNALPILEKFEGGDYFSQFYAYSLMELSDAIKAEQMSNDEQIKKTTEESKLNELKTTNATLDQVKEKLDEIIAKHKDIG